MGLKSMTGYASQDGALEAGLASYRWTWEVRSVNGKSLDMRLRLPTHLSALDQPARKMLPLKIGRGNIQVNLQLDTTRKEETLALNEAALQAILALSKKLHADHGVQPISMDGILALRNVLDTGGNDDAPADKEALTDALLQNFDHALDRLVDARSTEGAALQNVLENMLSEIERLVHAARNAPERAPDAIRAKLDLQIQEILEGSHDFSEERLYQEALMMAAKADIKEELDRLEAHVAAARGLIGEENAVGRRLDFLAQEFNREANTLCSKANDIAITNIGLALKAAIEQFREQVQNVE